jgi:hypothetical protein
VRPRELPAAPRGVPLGRRRAEHLPRHSVPTAAQTQVVRASQLQFLPQASRQGGRVRRWWERKP